MDTKKAVGGPPVRKWKNTTHTTTASPRCQVFPEKSSTPPADGTEAALLILWLQDAEIPPRTGRRAWTLADKWLRQFIDTRHPGRAA